MTNQNNSPNKENIFNDISKIDKILIYLPESHRKILASIPFLIEIQQYFPKGIFFIIASKQYQNLIDHIIKLNHDMKVFYIDLQTDDGWGGIHKYCYNLKEVFNIDFFFSLEPTMKKNAIGYFVKANKKYGIGTKMTSLLLTDFIQIKNESGLGPVGKNFSHNTYLKLLKFLNVSKQQKIDTSPLPKDELFNLDRLKMKVPDDYIIIPYKNFMLDEEIWFGIIKNFFKTNFILFKSSNESNSIDQFIEKINNDQIFTENQNKVHNFSSNLNYHQTLALIHNAKYLISSNDHYSMLAQLFSTPCSIIYKDDSEIKFNPENFFDKKSILNLYYQKKLDDLENEYKKSVDINTYIGQLMDLNLPRIFYKTNDPSSSYDSINKHIDDIGNFLKDAFI